MCARACACTPAHFLRHCFFYSISAKRQQWQPESVDHCQKSADPTVICELTTSWHPTLCRLKCKQSCVERLNHTRCLGMQAQIVINCINCLTYRKRSSVFWVYVLVCQVWVFLHVSLCGICIYGVLVCICSLWSSVVCISSSVIRSHRVSLQITAI